VARRNASYALVATILSGMPFSLVRAHDPATLDSLPSVHGGQVRMAGPFHVELVVLGLEVAQTDRLLLVYLQNHMFQDVSSSGLKCIARFVDGKHVTTVNLIPIESNGFSGRGAFKVNPFVTAEVSITDKNGEAWSATYTPFAAKVRNAPTE
jgi:hypothetical protein